MKIDIPDERIANMARYSLIREMMTRVQDFPRYGAVDKNYGGSEHDGLLVYEARTGRKLHVSDVIEGYAPAVAFSPAGTYLAVNIGMTVQIWMNPGKEIFSKPDKIVHRTIEASQIAGPHALNGRTAPAINDVRAADFNGDGKLDLVTANLGTNTISVFPGNGDGTFQKDTVFDSGGYGAFYAVGDLNKDGHPDFAIAHWREQDFVSVFLNKGDGTFLPSKDYKTAIGNYGVIFCDYDGDKNLDMISANYVDRSISVLKGSGDGTFAPAVTTKKEIHLVSGKWMPK